MNAVELMQAWLEVWHEGRLEKVAECLGETYIRHDHGGNRVTTRDEYLAEIRATRERIADLHFSTEDLAVSADRIWSRWRLTGTNRESGDPIDVSALQVYRIENGKLAETWVGPAPLAADWSAPPDAAAPPPPIVQ